jgi:hypothetical protein
MSWLNTRRTLFPNRRLLIGAKAVRQIRPPSAKRISGRYAGSCTELNTAPAVLVSNAVITDVDVAGEFSLFDVRGPVSFERCSFTKSTFESAHLSLPDSPQARFVSCSFDGMTIDGSISAGQALFERCTFRDILMRAWFPSVAEFVDCVFTGRIQGSRFFGTPFGPLANRLSPTRKRNRFSGNSFVGASLVDTAFSYGIDLSDQHLPSGEDYILIDDLPGVLDRALRAVSAWGDPERRRLGLVMLGGVKDEVESGQRQVFMNRGVFSRTVPPDVSTEIWALLDAD